MKTTTRILPSYYLNPIQGLYFDFALGVRIICKNNIQYKIKIYDDYTDILHHQFLTEKNKVFYSYIKYYIRWRIEVYKDDKIVYKHLLNLQNQKVVIQFSNVIGDLFAAISTFDQFQKKHKCNLLLYVKSQELIDILKDQYPNIIFTSDENYLKQPCYAYYLSSVGSVLEPNVNIVDCRFVGIQASFAYLFHIDESKILKAKLNLNKQREIKQKYVVISTSTSGQIKQWIKQNWIEVVKYLKSLGYIVYQIGLNEQLIDGCQNRIGNIHLQKRIDLIKDADMYIGMSSGLAWIADACNIPVIMICNITFPRHQFYTKYRIHPTFGCKGCFHQITIKYNQECSYSNKYECKRNITVKQVCNTIDNVIKDNYIN